MHPLHLQAQARFNLLRPTLRGESVAVSQSRNPVLGLIIGAGQHLLTDKAQRRFDLFCIDLDAPDFSLTVIPMTFFGHGIAANPGRPELLTIFEKRGPGACEIDISSGSVTRMIRTRKGREFYGHGTYSPDGKLLYSTETVVSGDYQGLIVVRDALSHEVLGDFPSYGVSPHDCRLIDNGDTLVVTNGGGPMKGIPPSITFVDTRSLKLKEKILFSEARINAGHLDIGREGSLAVVSAQREGLPAEEHGGISIRLASGELHTLRDPRPVTDRLTGESLSVCIHERSRVVGVTTPAGNILTFWDLDHGALLRYYDIPNPRGISLCQDDEHFAVSFGAGRPAEALCLINASSLDKVGGHDMHYTGITGSHLFPHTLPPAMRSAAG